MYNILVVHGPNLNLLGEREPGVYGTLTLADINARIVDLAAVLNLSVKPFQSNHEGAIIDFIHDHRKWAHGMVMNPGAYTHYSYAIRDAIAGTGIPTVEVHLSDIHKREEFRKISVIQPACIHQIYGKGLDSYLEGLSFIQHHLTRSN